MKDLWAGCVAGIDRLLKWLLPERYGPLRRCHICREIADKEGMVSLDGFWFCDEEEANEYWMWRVMH